MTTYEEVWEAMTIEELEAEISRRQKTLGEMVGTFYPSILRSEIQAISGIRLRKKYPARNDYTPPKEAP